jgi:hypothetical protein
MHLRKIISMAALCGLVIANDLPAAPSDEVRALLEKGNARAAYEHAKKHPDQLGIPAFDFYFGVAAIDAGHAGEGVLALERYLINYPANLNAKLELARGYHVLGENTRAREEFLAVLESNPPPAVVANIERFLDSIRAREAAYRTTALAFFELGGGYDSNINAGVRSSLVNLPNFGPVTVSQSGVEKAAAFAQLAAGASLSQPVAPGVLAFGSLAGNYKFNDGHPEFDLGDLGIQGGMSYLKDRNLFRGTLGYSTLEVDRRSYRDTAVVGGEWVHQLDELQAITGQLQYARLTYNEENKPRDADLYGISLGYRRAFISDWQPLLAANVSYGKEENRRDRDDLGRAISSARIVLSVTPRPRWAFGIGATTQSSDYEAPDVLFTTRRRDRYYAADVTVSYAFNRNLSLRCELLTSANESNIELYEYTREVAALKLRYEIK